MMSGSSSSLRVAAFTAVQWEELEQQALIYKYLMAGLPVPPDLVVPIRRSLEALSARFFHHPSLGLGYCSYYGKKFDPEPGRCRRTDGKKWRCSKDAYPDSKYCERHMNRGRSRSRKPVESQSTSQSLSTTMSHIPTGNSSGGGSFQSSGSSGSFQNLTYPVGSSESVCYGSNALKLQMEQSSPYGINKDYRYLQGLAPDADEHNFSQETLGSTRGLGMENNIDNTWRLTTSQLHSSSLLKPRNDFNLQGKSIQPNLAQAYELDAAMSKQRQQHCFFGNNVASSGPMKQEQHLIRPFLDEWTKTREPWSDLDNHKNAFSTTRLSISTPMAPSEYSSRSACSPDNG